MSESIYDDGRIVLRPSRFGRAIGYVLSILFLTVGSILWIVMREFTGFSFFALLLPTVLIAAMVQSIGLTLTITPSSVRQSTIWRSWEVSGDELVSWYQFREHDGGYGPIYLKTAVKEFQLSNWVVTGRKFDVVLTALRKFYGSKERMSGSVNNKI